MNDGCMAVCVLGELVQIWSCNQGDNQRWDLQTNIQSQIRVYNGQRCLNIINQTIIISDICNNNLSQIWKRSDDGSIVSILNGKCMEVTSSATGTRVTLATCNASLQQRWALGDNKVTRDTFPPTSPTNLVITNLQCRSVTLSWKAAADNVGVTAYDIYHDGQLMLSVAGSVLSTALTLVPGVNWGFYVNARDAAGGVSQASASLYVQVPQCSIDTSKPSIPTNVRGTVSGTTITLNWVASSDNIGVVAYDIYRNDIKVGSTSTLTFVDSSLATNTVYTYTIVARDAQSNISPKSTSITLTTAAACSNAICEVKQMTTDTDIPWGLITLPDGTIMYARRDAQDIIRLNPNNGQKTTVGIVPNVKGTDGEGGLLGLAVTPNFPSTDPWIYIYHTSATDNRIVRIKYNTDTIKIDPSSVQILLSGIGRNKYHNGGRLRFGPDGYLYATTGDAQNGNYAQDINNLAGKILRLKQDGSIPADNPFGNYVWSYGHRNPQGLAFDSQGRLWEQEFGNSIMDETNLIIRGGNYGWPACEGTRTISGTGCSTPGYIAPKKTYTTAEGSCSGIAIVSDVLYVACQRGTRMYREVISGSSLTNIQQYFIGTYGRLRTIEPSRDGGLWLTTTNKGDKDNIANNSDEKIFKIILGSGGTATSNSADVSSSPDPVDGDVVSIPSSSSSSPFPQWGYVIIVVTVVILILTIALLLVRRRRQKEQIHVQTCSEDGEMQMNPIHVHTTV